MRLICGKKNLKSVLFVVGELEWLQDLVMQFVKIVDLKILVVSKI